DFPSVSAKTVFNFVQGIRAEFNIPKVSSARDFQMVEELPYGSQAQVDFGFIIRPPQQLSKREYNSLLSFYRAAVISSFCLVIFLLPRQWLLMHMNKLFILLLLCLKKSFMIR